MENKQWATEYLLSDGYTLNHQPEDVQITPWSHVSRFATSQGDIYLKHTPPALSLEVVVINILHNQLHAPVPTVIGSNPELHCFLMLDAGIPLREYLKNASDKKMLHRAIPHYTQIQRMAEKNIAVFLQLGVPDWRLDKLPFLYEQFIRNEKFLQAEGITSDELHTLKKLQITFTTLCKHLSDYAITETIDHCDFHDNNILIHAHTRDITIIDWGETVITHPFFSLVSYLHQAMHRYALNETDTLFIEIQNACLENWHSVLQENILLACFHLTKKLWPIYAALGFYRLTLSSNAQTFTINSGRIAGFIKKFIAENSEEK
jgi:hypothetical protein